MWSTRIHTYINWATLPSIMYNQKILKYHSPDYNAASINLCQYINGWKTFLTASTSICLIEQKKWFIRGGNLLPIYGCLASVLLDKFQLLPLMQSLTRMLSPSIYCGAVICSSVCWIVILDTFEVAQIHLGFKLLHWKMSICPNTLPQQPLLSFIYGSWTITISPLFYCCTILPCTVHFYHDSMQIVHKVLSF